MTAVLATSLKYTDVMTTHAHTQINIEKKEQVSSVLM